MSEFLYESSAQKRRWQDTAAEQRGIYATLQWTGKGSNDPLNVAYGTAKTKPTKTDVWKTWRERQNRGAAPVLLVVAYPASSPTRAVLIGPKGEAPPMADVDLGQAERIASAALDEPSRHAAERLLTEKLSGDLEETRGVTNRGLLATHELLEGVPLRDDWEEAGERARQVIDQRDQDLIRGLGFGITQQGSASVLTDATSEHQRAVAVFLGPGERPDVPSKRHGLQTPVTYALAQADKQNIRWVLTVRGGGLRLYSTATSGAAGQRGRTDTYVELDLTLLPDDQAAYLHLLFSAPALAENGSVDQIRQASRTYATSLASRLRERVYDQVVPRLALAIAEQQPDLPLDEVYRSALTVLFRLLFIAYGEDQQLLPYDPSDPGPYHDVALKTRAVRLSRAINAQQDLGFDNPLTFEVEPTTDTNQTDMWDTVANLFHAVREGHTGWGIPAYGGGLFSADGDVNPAGPVIEQLRLSNGDFGPVLTALLVDRTPDDDVGPIDFRSLSVREFGTIYEGLLESELARATTDLALMERGSDQVYEPTVDPDEVRVAEGEVYLHNRSGARKASGSYFTKPFAVQHLLEHALVPTLLAHLDDVRTLLEAERPTDAAALLFDFRVADIAMGSGHFLTAIVDTMEKHISAFLSEHEIPPVNAELQRLRDAIGDRLGREVEVEQGALLRRLIARRCVYGVDINPISVELARVAMWIHTFVPGLPLSFLDHNLAVGNSLTGVATLDELYEAYGITPGATETMSMFADPITELLEAAEKPLQRLGSIADTSLADVADARAAAREAADALEPLTELCDVVAANRIGASTLPEFGSVDDLVSQLDRFDTGDLRETLAHLDPLHFPVAFPEVFLSDRGGFAVLVGNPPWEEATVERDGFWALRYPGLRSLGEAKKKEQIERLEDQRPDLVERYQDELAEMEAVRLALVGGPYPGMGTGDPDLYKAFAWRYWHLLGEGGRTGVILPRSAMAAKGSTEWRETLLERAGIERVTQLTNKGGWVFEGVHPQYGVCLNVLRKPQPGEHPPMRLYGPYDNPVDYAAGVGGRGAAVDPVEFMTWTPTASVPLLPSEAAAALFAKMRRHMRIGDLPFRYVTELHATNDKKNMVLDPSRTDGLWPVWKGATFDVWEPDTSVYYAWADPEHITRVLHDKRSRQTRKGGSFEGMSAEWINDPQTLPCLSARLVFRDLTRATDSRTCRAAMAPPQVLLANTAPYLHRRPEASAVDEAYLLGVMCSRIFDWQTRATIETHLNLYVLEPLAVPWPAADSPGRRRAAEIAARLSAVDERYAEWADEVGVRPGSVTDAEHDALIVELDAIVAKLYGLTEDEIRLVYDTFHPTWDHEPFRDAVLEVHAGLDFESARNP